MKKLLCLIYVTALLAGMTACGNQNEEIVSENNSESVSAESENRTDEVPVSETEEETSAENTDEENSDTDSESGRSISEGEKVNECITVPEDEETNEPLVNQSELFSLSDIDTEYSEEEAETVKEIALKVVDRLYHYDADSFAEVLAENSDMDMVYYGAFGNRVSEEELIPELKEEVNHFNLSGSETIVCNVIDVQTADSDDVFWKVMSMDSEMMKELLSSYDYDMSEIYTFDKAYKVIFDVTDESNPENDETGVQVYVVRTQEGEWKFETIFNFFYEAYYYDSEEFVLSGTVRIEQAENEELLD